MSSTFGTNLKLSIFGQSHGPSVGMVLDGIPAGLRVDEEKLQHFLNRRAPGNHSWSSSRKEEDRIEFLGGLYSGYTCGAPIAALIVNQNHRPSDYSAAASLPRPGHADYTAHIKYGGFQDASGGGHFSGRLTAPLCIAGGLCLQWLEEMGISVTAHIHSIADIHDTPFDPIVPQIHAVQSDFAVINSTSGEAMKAAIEEAKLHGDSLGGIIECAVTGLPAGVGEPMFEGIENKLAHIMFGIPAIKGIDFGSSDTNSMLPGSVYNDSFIVHDGVIHTATNHSGGILGGISNGMCILFRVRVKPTPSISQPQKTVSLEDNKESTISTKGRHDPCIVPRVVCAVEAAAAIAIYDLILGNTQTDRRKANGSTAATP